jgi:putative heme-binding domain-containing protein
MVVREGSGIPKPGKKIFELQCARCHALFGQGGKVGPDLTTYKRDDLDTMLVNIVNPSAEIREGFIGSVVAMSDGRILSGVIVDQDKNVVVIRDTNGHDATLNREGIDTMRPGPSSLMPEGLLDQLTGQEVRDLFAYLRSTQPLID